MCTGKLKGCYCCELMRESGLAQRVGMSGRSRSVLCGCGFAWGEHASHGNRQCLIAFEGCGPRIVAGLIEHLATDFDADRAGVVELFQQGEEPEVIDISFAGEDEAEAFFGFHRILHVDEASFWEKGSHAGFHLDSLKLEVAEVVCCSEGRGWDGFEKERKSFGRVHCAIDVRFEGEGDAVFFADLGPNAEV